MCNDRIWILLTRKLSGEATLTELKELDLLLEADLQQQATIEKISGVWNNRATPDEEFMEATYLAHLERTKEKGVVINNDEPLQNEDLTLNTGRKRKISAKWISLITLVTAGLLVGTLFINSKRSVAGDNNANSNREVSTKKGNRTKLKLPDGTDVWLNAGSKLNYGKNFEGNKREVYLTGEAFFDVVHNAERPFIIHTSKIGIKVLGTQFNVKAYENDITTETSLINGKVEVTINNNPGKKFYLKPLEKLVLTNAQMALPVIASMPGTNKNKQITVAKMPAVEIKPLSYLSDYNTDIESSWTRNILSFDDELFSEVAKKMERWYDVSITFKNKRWEKRYVSGAFEHESLEQALEALKYTSGFKYIKVGNEINIY